MADEEKKKKIAEITASWGLQKDDKIEPRTMTDDEIANLRFTTVSEKEAKAVTAELKRRGY